MASTAATRMPTSRSARSRGRPAPIGAPAAVPAPGTSLGRDQRHAPHRPARPRSTVTVPDPRARGERPVELVRARSRGAGRAGRRGRSATTRAARHELGRARRGTRRPPARPARARGRARARAGSGSSPQRSSASVSASRAASLGSPSTTLTTRAPRPAAGRAHEHVAGVRSVWPVFTPSPTGSGRSGRCGSSTTRGRGARLELGRRHVHDPREAPVAQQHARERGEVARGRVVAGLVEADRVRVARVVEAELARARRSSRRRSASREPETSSASVTAASFALSSSSASSRSCDRHPLALAQVDPRLRGHRRCSPGAVNTSPGVACSSDEQRGHQLGGARDRALARRGAWRTSPCRRGRRPRSPPRRPDARRGAAPRRRRPGSGRAPITAASGEHAPRERHSRSLIFWPATSACGSSSGFSSWSRSTVVPSPRRCRRACRSALIV